MTVTLDLQPEIEEMARAAAQVRGISLEDYLLLHLAETMGTQKYPTSQEMDDFEADLDALINGDEKAAAQPNEAFRRIHIYGED